MLGRGLVGMLRQPLRVLRAAPTTLPHLDDVVTVRHLPGVKTIARSGRMIKRLIPARLVTDPPCTATTSSPPRPGSKPAYRRTAESRSDRCRSLTSR